MVMSLLQEAVIKGEDWFFALVERSSDLLVVINQDGVLLYANPAASEMFGVPLEVALGRTAFQYLHPDDLKRVMAQYTELVASPGTSNTDTVRFVSATGEVRMAWATSLKAASSWRQWLHRST